MGGRHAGTFSQRWQVGAESWVRLPGSLEHWPQEVKVDGGKVKIRVLEILEKSVVISVENQPQKVVLKLRDVILKFGE